MSEDKQKKDTTASNDDASNERAFKEKLQLIQSGNMGLQETFWVYFLAVFVVLSFAGALLGSFGQILSIASAGWAVFMVMPVFRAADQYGGIKVFAIMAKIAVVLTAAAVAMGVVLKFLAVFM